LDGFPIQSRYFLGGLHPGPLVLDMGGR
jgi:hypothetical protein